MLYTLVVAFIARGTYYVEQRHLTLQHCAGQAAIARTEYLKDAPKLGKLGEVRYYCWPEKALSK